MTTAEHRNDEISFKGPGCDWRSLSPDIGAKNEELERQQQQARLASEELKNALLTSLQMQHLVVLAGSGCSLEVGGPSMGDLWETAIGNKPSDEASEIAERVHYDLDQPDSGNIEAFLSQVEAFLQVQDDENVQSFLSECKRKILAECSEFLDAKKLGAHKTFLHRLSRRRVRDQRLRVFTTNYDLCFERAASDFGGVAIDGFSFTAPRRYDPRFFAYDIIRRPRGAEDQGSYLDGVFLLYKLHGSVNWARMKDGTILEKSNPAPNQACLIYPAAGKYHQSFLQPHLESISQYLAALREPNTCLLVVGFGFNDDHLSEPLLAAIQSNPHLRLIVVGPGAAKRHEEGGKANRYWRSLFDLSQRGEDIWFINAEFSTFADMIPDLKALTPADTLMKAIKSAARGN
jgi:NAD-dependent SIR2 family protein deacetylase